MKKLILIISLFICYYAQYEDCSQFEAIGQVKCGTLSNSTHSCIFSNGQCIANFIGCSAYVASNDKFVDSICTSIISPNANKKCSVKTTNDGAKLCDEETKKCNEYKFGDDCKSLIAGTNKRCVLYKGNCEEHSDECTGLSSNDCSKNIPRDNTQKCVWDTSSSSCISKNRLCSDFISYVDEEGGSLQCSQIEIESPKECFFDGKNCIDVIPRCQDGDNTNCEEIKPLTSDKDAYDIDTKCIYDDGACGPQSKECEDYEDDCETKSASNINKMCALEGNKCKEIYITCDSYDALVNEGDRQSNACAAITPRNKDTKAIDYYSKCVLNDDHECESVLKECNEFNNNKLLCNYHKQDEDKICIFKNNQCQEQYRTCELYNSEANKNKGGCESILPKYPSEPVQKCIYVDVEGTSTCKKERMECEDYTGTDAAFCNSITTNDTTIYKCVFRGDKCVAEYNGCGSYDGKERKVCESIKLDNEYNKCVLENDKDCVERNKLCSEYLGIDEFECKNKYIGSDEYHSCNLINNKCVEVKKYKYCSDYKGTNKQECEAIQPYKLDNNAVIDLTSRCIFKENEGCIRQSLKCGDATNAEQCQAISNSYPSDSKKNCAFINNQCKEQFKSCELYNSEATIEKTICDSIVFGDILTDKCVYEAPASGQTKGTCTAGTKICSDLKIELFKSECTALELTDVTKTCEFSNNVCSDTKKYCSELSNESGLNNDKCNSAKVLAANHICVLKKDNSGCEEIINTNYVEPTTKPNQPTNQQPQTQTQPQQQEETKPETTENNSGGKNIFKALPYFLWILL